MGGSFFRAVLGLGLTTGPLHDALISGAVTGLLTLVALRRDRSWWLRTVPPDGINTVYVAVDPLAELARHRYPASAGYFVAGADDHDYRPQQRAVVRAALASGMTVVAREPRGQHSYRLWGPALSGALPWLTTRMGLSP